MIKGLSSTEEITEMGGGRGDNNTFMRYYLRKDLTGEKGNYL